MAMLKIPHAQNRKDRFSKAEKIERRFKFTFESICQEHIGVKGMAVTGICETVPFSGIHTLPGVWTARL